MEVCNVSKNRLYHESFPDGFANPGTFVTQNFFGLLFLEKSHCKKQHSRKAKPNCVKKFEHFSVDKQTKFNNCILREVSDNILASSSVKVRGESHSDFRMQCVIVTLKRREVLSLMTFSNSETLSNFEVHESLFTLKFIFVCYRRTSVQVNSESNGNREAIISISKENAMVKW